MERMIRKKQLPDFTGLQRTATKTRLSAVNFLNQCP
jgi:hypothetical protein